MATPPSSRQIRRESQPVPRTGAPPPGIGVDAYAQRAIDPTENVLALVDAQARFQEKVDDLRGQIGAKERDWIIKHFEALMVAERRRLDNLAEQKKDYDKQISETQTGQMKTTSDLVFTQLDKVITSLSDTINKTADNIAGSLASMDKRISAVEQFRYETGGRSAVQDPAMEQIGADLRALTLKYTQTTGVDAGAHQQRIDMGTVAGWIVMAAIATAGVVFGFLDRAH